MAEMIAFDVAASLLEKLGSTAYKEISLAWGLKSNMEKLKEDINLIKGLLIDAVENQLNKEPVIDWLTRLKNLFLDAEDVLDEFECEKQRRKFVEEYGSLGRKVRRFISRSNPLFFSLCLGHTVEDITKTLDKLYADRQILGLNEKVQWENSRNETSFVYSKIIGRDDEQRKIVDHLAGKGSADAHKRVSVIHIHGMAGIGKTGLAKLVYNDERVERYFQLKIWVSVSKELEVQTLLETMLEYVTKKKNEKSTVDHLIDELQGHLKKKRFLLILDNVWDENEDKWEELSGYLLEGCKGSKIIITTRNQQLKIPNMEPDVSHKVEGLCSEYSLSLFLKHTCVEAVRDINRRQRLIKIGKEIATKCEGVPLVLKTVGNLLYKDSNEHNWNRIKESKIWESQRVKDKVFATLLLSYNDLSFDLKRCFLCCSLFPRRKVISSLELIQLWIAHDVLQLDENKCLEDIGHEVFNKLCLKSFFKNVINHGWYYTFHMDEVIHEFALFVAKDEYFMVKTPHRESGVPKTVRHLAIRQEEVPSSELEDANGVELPLKKMRSVRTIIFPCLSTKPLIQSFFNKHLIKNYVNLRMLDLSRSSFETLPSYIGGMKRLRSLNLSWNRRLTKLPDSICKLQSLQSLQLQGCTELESLPRNIKNLRKSLIFLSVTTNESFFDDNGIPCLTSLRTLIIDECHKLELMPYKVTKSLEALKTLVISNCEELWFYEEPEIVPTIRLQRLNLFNLPKVDMFPSWLQGCKESLQYLRLSSCSNLSRQLWWLLETKSLVEVHIIDCPELLLLLFQAERHDNAVVVRFEALSEGQKQMNYYQHEEIQADQQIKIREKASSDESSTDSRLTEKIWSEEERFELIQTMLDLYKSGKLKAEEISASPAGHLEAIKKSLVVKLPGLSDIATEHIESEVRILKKRFDIVHEIFNGLCRNEFEWNSNEKMVTAKELSWDVYTQIHPEAKEFRDKPFPFYKELEELYSTITHRMEARNKDLRSLSLKASPSSSSPSSVLVGKMKTPASVEGAEIIRGGGIEEGERKQNWGSTSFSKPPPHMAVVSSSTSSSSSSDIGLTKENKHVFGFGEMIGESMKEAARIIAGEIKEVFGGIDAKFVRLNDELTNNTALTMTERHKATRIISQNAALLSILFSLPHDEKEEWVRTLLEDST